MFRVAPSLLRNVGKLLLIPSSHFHLLPPCTELPLLTRRALVRWPPLQRFAFLLSQFPRNTSTSSTRTYTTPTELKIRCIPFIRHSEARYAFPALCALYWLFLTTRIPLFPLPVSLRHVTRHLQLLPRSLPSSSLVSLAHKLLEMSRRLVAS